MFVVLMLKQRSTTGRPEFTENEMVGLTKIFKSLSEPSKIRILSLLDKSQSMSVSDIAESTGLEISLVSHHLSRLREQGFVKPQKKGKHVYYSIDDDCIIDILQRARDHVAGN
jgi:ArsR family transcriptional regulator